jgi:hypothetical protein
MAEVTTPLKPVGGYGSPYSRKMRAGGACGSQHADRHFVDAALKSTGADATFAA